MNVILVRLGDRSYKILTERNLEKLPLELRAVNLGTDAAVITNPKINSLFGRKIRKILKAAGLRTQFILVPDSEKAKSLSEGVNVLTRVSKIDGKGKRVCIIALGGGVVGDLSGFVASIYRRGIPYVQIPTTLLAQVDSSIGGKAAIDLPTGKNLTGSFFQPKMVYIDISFLKKLSRRDFVSGIAEVIKYGVIKDRALFRYLEENKKSILRRDPKALMQIVKGCAKIKADIVSKDERERRSIRTILNFGHTIGHAIEAACGYSVLYSHGEAVGLGMIAASRISNRTGLLSKTELSRIEKLIASFGLPVFIKKVNMGKVMKSLTYDKKFIHGVTRFVLPVRIGKVIIKERIPYSLIREELNALVR